MKSAPEELFAVHVRANGLPVPEREARLHPTRKWRVDYAWRDALLVVEIEGGVYVRGRHTQGAGYESDCEKYDELTLLGYRILRFTPRMVKSGYAIDATMRALLTKNSPAS